jgi:hypothetical protein
MTKRVHAEFSQHERRVSHDVLQPQQVAVKGLQIVEVDVERGKVEKREIEVFGGREVGVGHEAGGVGLLHFGGKRAQECAHTVSAMPANNVGRNLVTDRIAQNAREALAHFSGPANGLSRLGSRPAAVEKAEVLRPGDVDEQSYPAILREFEKPVRRHPVGADTVDACLSHQVEICPHLLWRRKRFAGGIGREWAIGHAAGHSLDAVASQVLAIDLPPRGASSRPGHSRILSLRLAGRADADQWRRDISASVQDGGEDANAISCDDKLTRRHATRVFHVWIARCDHCGQERPGARLIGHD